MSRQRIHCGCGASLTRPLPSKCPECGALITAIRHRRWPQMVSLLLFAAMLAGLMWCAWALLGN